MTRAARSAKGTKGRPTPPRVWEPMRLSHVLNEGDIEEPDAFLTDAVAFGQQRHAYALAVRRLGVRRRAMTTRSERDDHFGFYKRPTKVERLDDENGGE